MHQPSQSRALCAECLVPLAQLFSLFRKLAFCVCVLDLELVSGRRSGTNPTEIEMYADLVHISLRMGQALRSWVYELSFGMMNGSILL
jgi:hypothetical protein